MEPVLVGQGQFYCSKATCLASGIIREIVAPVSASSIFAAPPCNSAISLTIAIPEAASIAGFDLAKSGESDVTIAGIKAGTFIGYLDYSVAVICSDPNEYFRIVRSRMFNGIVYLFCTASWISRLSTSTFNNVS